MTIHLQHEIEKLEQKILSIGALVEKNLRQSIIALIQMDENLAAEILDIDLEIDFMEVDLEEDCLKVLALHQPVAIDLRLIVAILKINNDLERIGDLAVNIAERTIYLADRDRVEMHFDYQEMARKAEAMVKKSLDALVNLDPELASQVCAADDEVDDMNREMQEQVKAAVKTDPDNIGQYVAYLLVARHLERIADHATNIAEDVIYMVKGEIVRHRLGPNPKIKAVQTAQT